jgi:hypothetical protein
MPIRATLDDEGSDRAETLAPVEGRRSNDVTIDPGQHIPYTSSVSEQDKTPLDR